MAYAKIRPRRGTLYEWASVNPVIAEGEFVVEVPETGVGTGLCKFKIGDGFTQYQDLPYAFDGESVSAIYGGSVTNYNNIYLRSGTTEEWTEVDPILGVGEIAFDTTTGLFKIGDGTSTWSELEYYDTLHYVDGGTVTDPFGIYMRRGTTNQWEASDPVLSAGEIGYDTTVGKIKIGDGTSKWSELEYIGAVSSVDGGTVEDPFTITMRSGTSEEWETTDPVLEEGEIGYDSTTGEFKIGDGTSSWTELSYIGSSAVTLGSEDVGSGVNPIYLTKGVATASTETVGAENTPVYLSKGVITKCGDTLAVNISGTATYAMSIGSGEGEDIGSSSSLVYFQDGVATESTETIGGENQLVYLKEGTFTASTTTVGSSTTPVYLEKGVVTASTETVGSGSQPVYLNSGKITASTSSVGSSTKPVYLSAGVITASTASVGSTSVPVHITNGTIMECDSLYGGNVSSSYTITVRSGTTAQWASSNPVLEQGEIAFDTTLYRFKIGDGTSKWSDLSYFISEDDDYDFGFESEYAV